MDRGDLEAKGALPEPSPDQGGRIATLAVAAKHWPRAPVQLGGLLVEQHQSAPAVGAALDVSKVEAIRHAKPTSRKCSARAWRATARRGPFGFRFPSHTKEGLQTGSSAEPKNGAKTMGYKFRTYLAESGALETNGLRET
jgi:hypothetical protein